MSKSPFLTLEEAIAKNRPGRIVRRLYCPCGGDVESVSHPQGMKFKCLTCPNAGLALSQLVTGEQ